MKGREVISERDGREEDFLLWAATGSKAPFSMLTVQHTHTHTQLNVCQRGLSRTYMAGEFSLAS